MKAHAIGLALLLTAVGAASAATITVPVPDCTVSLEAGPAGHTIAAPGYGSLSSPGDPALPYKDVHILLPPDADLSSLSITLGGATTQQVEGVLDIAPAPPAVAQVGGKEVVDWGHGKRIQSGRNTLVYSRNDYFPADSAAIVTAGGMRAWRLARVRYYPYRYNPVAKRLIHTSGGEVVINYQSLSRTSSTAPITTDGVFEDTVSTLAANYTEARGWYPSGPERVAAGETPGAATGYAIITTSAVVTGSAKLTAFVNHKISRGFSVTIATESNWGGGHR